MKGHKITSRCLESITNALCHLSLIWKAKAKLELKSFFLSSSVCAAGQCEVKFFILGLSQYAEPLHLSSERWRLLDGCTVSQVAVL